MIWELAIESHDVSLFKLLLFNGHTQEPNSSSSRETLPYHVAQARRPPGGDEIDVMFLEMLHEHRVDLGVADHKGVTPLHAAARRGKENVVRYLLSCNVPLPDAKRELQIVSNHSNTAVWSIIVEEFAKRRMPISSTLANRKFSPIGRDYPRCGVFL